MKLPRHEYTLISNQDQIKEAAAILSKAKYVGFDIETDGLDWWGKTPIVGIGFGALVSKELLRTWYLPTGHIGYYAFDLHPSLRHLLVNGSPKIGANIKFDAHFMYHRHGFLLYPMHDIQVLARLLRTDARSVALDALIKLEFKTEHKEWRELIAYCRSHRIRVAKGHVVSGGSHLVPPAVLGPYCCADVYWTLLLFFRYWHEVKKQPKVEKLYEAIERPLLDTVMEMEEVGVQVDRDYLLGLKTKLAARAKDLETAIYETAGKVFDIASQKQLKEVLQSNGLKPQERLRKKIQNGKEVRVKTPSYDKIALESYKVSSPLVKAVLDWRQAKKFEVSYVDSILTKSTGFDAVHFSIRQETARTGRMGASEPNIQNLPRNNEENEFIEEYSIRRAFLPSSPSRVLLSIDYSNIEVRLLAHFSQDPKLIDSFARNEDFHQIVADAIGKSRAVAKTFTFAQLYGSGIANLAAKTGVTESQCAELLDRYNDSFPYVGRFKRGLQRWCEKNGYVENPFGRRRLLPPELAYRAVNTLIQGTAADILKVAIIRVSRFLRYMYSKLLYPVHDELVIDYDTRDGDIVPSLQSLMGSFEKNERQLFRVPITTEVSISHENWGVKRKWEAMDSVEALLSEEKYEGLYGKFLRDSAYRPWLSFGERLGFNSGQFFWYLSIVDKLIKGGPQQGMKKKLLRQLQTKKGGLVLEDLQGMPRMPWQNVRGCEGQMGEMQVSGTPAAEGAASDGWS